MNANLAVSIIVLAAVYSLIGSGFVVMFRATGVLSFAQGSFLLLGTLAFYSLSRAGVPGAPALVAACLVVGLLAAVLYLVLFDRARPDPLFLSLATAGLSVALGALALIVWKPDLFQMPSTLSTQAHTLVGGVRASPAQIFEVALALALAFAFVLFLRFTPVGLRMRATSDSRELAHYAGIRVSRVSALAWGISGAVAAAGGIAYSIGQSVDPSTFSGIGLAVFPAIIVGGMDSLLGVVVGSLLLAAIQSLVDYHFGSRWDVVIPYVLLLGVLAVRPTGLFGSKAVARV
jgi:branched-chain amino acid transport system permease protein